MKLHEWRQSKGLTTRELARLTAVRPSYISDIEHGRHRPPDNATIWETLARLDGMLTEADFRAMGTIEPETGETWGFMCAPGNGCQLTRFVDGQPSEPKP